MFSACALLVGRHWAIRPRSSPSPLGSTRLDAEGGGDGGEDGDEEVDDGFPIFFFHVSLMFSV